MYIVEAEKDKGRGSEQREAPSAMEGVSAGGGDTASAGQKKGEQAPIEYIVALLHHLTIDSLCFQIKPQS